MFINFTQHTLTEAQRAAAMRMAEACPDCATIGDYCDLPGGHEACGEFIAPGTPGGKVAEMRDLEPALFARIAQICGECDIQALAAEVADLLVEKYWQDIIHLPIGLPAFMFALAGELQSFWAGGANGPRIVFSHSTRQSVDVPQPDGSVRKQAMFVFERFLGIGPIRDQQIS